MMDILEQIRAGGKFGRIIVIANTGNPMELGFLEEFDADAALWYADPGTITVSVDVENTGAVSGKDVAQVYFRSPCTDYDKANRIKKAAVNLIAFGKTGVLTDFNADWARGLLRQAAHDNLYIQANSLA